MKSNQHLFQAVFLRIRSFFEIQIQYFYVDFKKQVPMTKSAFKDISFLGVLNWVTIHSQTEKYVEIFLHLLMEMWNIPELSK